MKPKKTIYFEDELHDDFAKHGMPSKPLPEDYPYVRENILWRALSSALYWCLAAPLAWLISRVWFGVRVHNRKALRQVRGSVFLYANHTQSLHDAYMPLLLAAPRKNYIVVGPSAVSVPGLRTLVQLLGGIPVPSSVKGLRRFMAALERRTGQGAAITIYPEAHIWPYYTGVRPFPDSSFGYPVRMNRPVVAVATTYRQRKIFKNARPAIDVTVSGPFYPDTSLPDKKARAALRQQVYDFLKRTIETPDNAAYYEYKRKEPDA